MPVRRPSPLLLPPTTAHAASASALDRRPDRPPDRRV